MILQSLVGYYQRIADNSGDVEPEGYKRIPIPFIITLSLDGHVVGVDDTRSGERNDKGVPRVVPKIFEGSRTSNVQANLLWDKASYVFGVGDSKKIKRLKQQKEHFLQTIYDYFPLPSDEGVLAVISFLEKYSDELAQHNAWEEIVSKDAVLAFRLDGQVDRLICNRQAVINAIDAHKVAATVESGVCALSGNVAALSRLENPIKGLRGSGKAESHLVAFNESAYWSYGRDRGKTFPMSKAASSAYVAAINYLQRAGSKQYIRNADATVIFWAEREHEMEGWFADFFGEPPKGSNNQDAAGFKALIEAPKSGALPILDDKTRFYVLGLAPNASRIAIRFWYQGSVGEVAGHIRQHFDDINIVHGPKDPEYLSLFRLLVSTAMLNKADNILPNLAGDFMKAILAGTPYPQTLLSSAIRRCRAEQDVTYPRAALIKAVLARKNRRNEQNTKEVGMALDTSNTNPGYLLGRLFAVLERAQEQASPGINATIRDRFYGAASSTPVAVFAHLMKLKNHHIAKIDSKGAAVNLEKLIQEIVDNVGAADAFPAHLALDDQGRFAVGYYHQRQDFFKKKTDDNTKEA